MQTTHAKLQAIELKLKRWHTRLHRASNAIRKLEQQRKRLTLQSKLADIGVKLLPDPKPPVSDAVERPRGHAVLADLPGTLATAARESAEDAKLDIPVELRRTAVKEPAVPAKQTAAQDLADLLNPAAVMNRKRLAKLDAKRRGYQIEKPIDKTAMPLSGREALKAVRALRKK